MTTLYLSGASSEHQRAAAIERRIWGDVGSHQARIHLNDRWWVDPSFSGKDHQHAPEERRRISKMHFVNIEEADVFWLLTPSKGHHSRGAWCEYGYAHALGRALTIVVSGEFAHHSVFTSLSDRLFLTDDEALAYVLDLARKS